MDDSAQYACGGALMYSTLFTPADLAADARADMQTIATHIRLLTPAEARGAGV